MSDTELTLIFWHWLAFGLVLMLVELVLPSTYFLWMGLAAMVVGVLLWLMPGMSFDVQTILFAVLSVSAIFLGKRYLKRHPIESERPMLNVRGAQNVGRMATLREPIVNGVGRVHLDDTLWKVVGSDMPQGAQVEVIGVEGTALRVKLVALPAESGSSSSSRVHDDQADGDGGGGD